MNSLSPLIAWLIVLFVLGVAAYFARQQVQTLRHSRREDLSPEDRRYFRRQVWRRLFGCALLVAIAVLIALSYVTGQEERIDALGDQIQAQVAAGERQLQPEQAALRRFYAWYWITVLLLLLALIGVATVDMLAIRRYGLRHFRKIRDDRRAMLEQHLAELRRERRQREDGPPTGS